MSLECCEERSVSHIAVLDSIAQVKLQRGDLGGCRTVLEQIEDLKTRSEHSKSEHYHLWALQTKVQLLLREGNVDQAKTAVRAVTPIVCEVPQPRVNTASYLLAAETFVATGDLTDAVKMLCSVLEPTIPIPPDLFAQTEQVTAKVINSNRGP